MSNSKMVCYTKISPHRTSPRNHKIDKITIHHMAGTASIEACGQIFQTREASSNYGVGNDGRIAMYVEEKDRSWASSNAANDHRAVTIEVANSACNSNWPVSDEALEATIELCADICRRNGIEKLNFTGDKNGNLTQHNYFAATACPGPYLKSKFQYIADEVNRRLEVEPLPVTKPETRGYTLDRFIRDVQSVTGSVVDGIAGPETIGNTVTISRFINDDHPVVKFVQKRLAALGYTQVGQIDGVAGPLFDDAMKAFQKDNGCHCDGEATRRCLTWKKLLGMA